MRKAEERAGVRPQSWPRRSMGMPLCVSAQGGLLQLTPREQSCSPAGGLFSFAAPRPS